MKWNKSNTVILAVMILVVSGIGVKQGDVPHGMTNQTKTQETQERVQPSEDDATAYQETQQCVVHIEMGNYKGSGLVWTKDEEKIVIASCKHLLLEGEQAEITFFEGSQTSGVVTYCTTAYDLGFVEVKADSLSHELYEKISTVKIPKSEELWKNSTYVGFDVIQSSTLSETIWTKEQGYITGYEFHPIFYCEVLETQCDSQPGMSGGGVFSQEGLLLGMILGGQPDENASVRDSVVTYSLSAMAVQEAYETQEGQISPAP